MWLGRQERNEHDQLAIISSVFPETVFCKLRLLNLADVTTIQILILIPDLCNPTATTVSAPA